MGSLFKKMLGKAKAKGQKPAGSEAVTGIAPGRGTSNTADAGDSTRMFRRGRRPDTPLGGRRQSM